jgi:pimeloyl-ACP methyl ester carboxylesterase
MATTAALTVSLVGGACSGAAGLGGAPTTAATMPLTQASARCGPPAVPAKMLRFPAGDGTQLDGAMVGSGPAGVILVHQADGDLCGFWPYAVYLSQRGLRVLAIDLRCYGDAACPSADTAGHFTDDLVGATAELRRQGARSVALVGASLGAMVALIGATTLQPPVAAVVSLSGPAGPSNPLGEPPLDVAAAVRQLTRPVLYVVAREDSSVGVDEVRSLYKATPAGDKHLMVLSGAYTASHGWELLTNGSGRWNPTALADQVATFIERHATGQ